MNPGSKTIRSLAAALLLLAALIAVCNAVLPSAAFVEAVVQFDHRDRMQLFYSGGRDFSERHSVFSEMIAPDQPQTVHIALHHAPMRQVRLDIGEHPGTVRLCKLTVAAFFAEDASSRPTFSACSAAVLPTRPCA